MASKVQEQVWKAEGSQKRKAVKEMFSEIAPTYDLMNSIICMRLHSRWRRAAVELLTLKPGDTAVDVCSGTGDFLVPLRQKVSSSGTVVGIDFCPAMLAVAQTKNTENLALGDACQLPLRGETAHGVTVGWGIRNVPDIDAAHREITRVLKPGGRFVSVDMALPKNALVRSASTFVFHRIVPLLGALFGKRNAYTYLPKSTSRFMSREQLSQSMKAAGLIDVTHRDRFFGNICIHFGRKP